MGSFMAYIFGDENALPDLLGLVEFFDGSLGNILGSVDRVLGSSTPEV